RTLQAEGVERYRGYAVDLSSDCSLDWRDLESHRRPRALAVGKLEIHAQSPGFRDRPRLGSGDREIARRRAERLVEASEHVVGTVAERRVIVPRGTRLQAETQLHRDAALEHEQRVVALVTGALERGGDHHVGDPPLQARRRDVFITRMVGNPALK